MEALTTRKRYFEMDLARALPLLFLPIVHCYEEFHALEMLSPAAIALGKVWLYLCAFGPSVFMMVLGLNISFSSHTSPKELLRRGLTTILLFVGLNLVRITLPALIGYIFVPDPEVIDMAVYTLLQSDILMFAGLSFLFFALMKRLNIPPLWIVLFTALLCALSMTFSLDMPLTLWTGFLGNFVRVNEASAFPAMPWLIYPAIGYMLGEILKSRQSESEERRFYHNIMGIGLCMMLVMGIALYSFGYEPLTIGAAVVRGNITDVFNVILDAGLSLFWLGIFYDIWRLIKNQRIRAAAVKVSKAIMIFYIAQWVIVGWFEVIMGAFFWRSESIGIWVVLLSGTLIAIAAMAAALPIQEKRERRKALRHAGA